MRKSAPDDQWSIVHVTLRKFLERNNSGMRRHGGEAQQWAGASSYRLNLRKGYVQLMLCSTLGLCAYPAYPAGLGSLQLQSTLRTPFRARIPLLGLDTNGLQASCIKARLASLDGEFISTLRSDVLLDRENSAVVLTSTNNINEPVASVFVEVSCGLGIQREYQILLDPPHLVAADKTSNPVTEVRGPGVVAEPARQPAIPSQRPGGAAPDRPMTGPGNTPGVKASSSARTASANASGITKSLNSRDRNVLRLAPVGSPSQQSAGVPEMLSLTLSTTLSDPGSLPAVIPSIPPANHDTADSAGQLAPADGQLQAMQARINALEQELVRLRPAGSVSGAGMNRVSENDSNTPRWLIGFGLMLLLATGWLIWRIRRLKVNSSGVNWNDEAGKETIRKATLLAMARTEQKRQPGLRPQNPVHFDAAADLQSALEKNYTTAEKISGDQGVASRINQKTAVAEFIHAKPDTIEFPGKKEYVTSGALLQTAFDVELGNSRGQTVMTEAEEIVDVRQQAEFWMSLQDPQRAVQALELYTYEHVQRPDSPLPWLLLFDLYRDLSYQEQYEALYERFRGRFNSKVPRWGEEPPQDQSAGLESFPRLLAKASELWNTSELVPFLEGLLLDDREGKREGFDLPVFNDILFLTELAYELRQLPTLELEPVVSEDASEPSVDRWGKSE